MPQVRERVILVGALKSFKQKFYFPKPIKTHFCNQFVLIHPILFYCLLLKVIP
ncbi:hypothetical protein HMPREF1433_01475 [Helicobacter pylori GAMchJs117Ai]|nr:hypothetical protein HMPREF1433_01475 [Helicobacter pylori GAMchJs117Ai]